MCDGGRKFTLHCENVFWRAHLHAAGWLYDTSSDKDHINLYGESARVAVAQCFRFFYPDFQSPISEQKMTSHVKLRRERVGLVDYETQIKGNIIMSSLVLTCCNCCQRVWFLWRGKGTLLVPHLQQIMLGATFSRMVPCRDALPACGPAEGFWPAAGAEKPAAAGPDGLPSAAGRDWKRVRAFPRKTGRPLRLQDQEVATRCCRRHRSRI